MTEIDALKSRIAELEAKQPGNAAPAPLSSLPEKVESAPSSSTVASPAVAPIPMATVASIPAPPPQDEGGHDMTLLGGPKLNIRGFLDFNLGLGSIANPLIYPLTIPPTPVHNTFQLGEFDLFLNSRLSSTISFLGEVVLAADASNFWGLDVERAQITYKPSEYFQISGGRIHTAIGFYNTTFHHGAWFQTTTGRPYMYYFEDSGGILPVHIVGVEAAGLIPRTGRWNAHWIAEVGNDESSLFIGQPNVTLPIRSRLIAGRHP
jgi:hypothetical protein